MDINLITDEQLAAALRQSYGVRRYVTQALGVSRAELSGRIAGSPELQCLVEELDEESLDSAEFGLKQAVDSGEKWAIQYLLKARGAKRKLVPTSKTEISGVNGSPLLGTFSEDELRSIAEGTEPL